MVKMAAGQISDGIRMVTLFICGIFLWKEAGAGTINMVQYRFDSDVPEDLTSTIFQCAFRHITPDSRGIKFRHDGGDDCTALTLTELPGDSSYLNLIKHEQITQPIPANNDNTLELTIPGTFTENSSISVTVQCDDYTKAHFGLSLIGDHETMNLVIGVMGRYSVVDFDYTKYSASISSTRASQYLFPMDGRACEVKFHVSDGIIEVEIDKQPVHTRASDGAIRPDATKRFRMDNEGTLYFQKFYFSR